MKNLIILLLIAFAFTSCCKDEEPVFVGDVILSTQSEVDAFGRKNYEVINGDLLIGSLGDYATYSDIHDLSSLIKLNKVKYNLTIANTDIISVEGLNNLSNVGLELLVTKNSSLNSLEGLRNLTYSGGLVIFINNELETLSGLEGIETIQGNLEIAENQNLLNIDGLDNLKKVTRDLRIDFNYDLIDITALSNLNFVRGRFSITGNRELPNLNGLSRITESSFMIIGGNLKLSNIDGLSNLKEVKSLHISWSNRLTNLDALQNLEKAYYSLDFYKNSELTDFCGLTKVLKSAPHYVTIKENKYNPTVEDILAGNCAQ